MRKIFTLALLVLAIGSTAALAADPSLGTWKANMAKTKYTPAPWPVKNLVSVHEAAPGGVKVTNTGERDSGPINSSYTAMYDGTPATVSGTGAPYDTIIIKKLNPRTFTYDAKSSKGKYHAHGSVIISLDGKTMTQSATGTDAEGKPMSLTLVFDKQ